VELKPWRQDTLVLRFSDHISDNFAWSNAFILYSEAESLSQSTLSDSQSPWRDLLANRGLITKLVPHRLVITGASTVQPLNGTAVERSKYMHPDPAPDPDPEST